MKILVIAQNAHGFFIEICAEPPAQLIGVAENTIPAINLTKPYSDYSGKSVLEIVEKFFTEPPIEKT